MDSETYYIPVNYTDAGKLFGLFEIRNAIESVVLGLPVLGLCTALLPFTITWKIIVTPAGADRGICADWPEGRQLDPLFENLVDLASAAPGPDLSWRGECP
mgnify:CR=1 FL=1